MAFHDYRIAPPDRVRNVDTTHAAHADGGFACKDCGDKVVSVVYGDRKVRPPVRCEPCRQERMLVLDILSGRRIAQYTVSVMRKTGELPDVRTLACVDCARPAECWDHRDYNEPRRVDAVCLSCNVIRGHALPFNPYLAGLFLIQYVRECAQRSRVDADPLVSGSSIHGAERPPFFS